MTVSTETQSRWFTSHVHSLMKILLNETVEPDSDGDFYVSGDTCQLWVRVNAREPWGVQVFAHAAKDVPMKMAVLKEINDANCNDPAIRVAWYAPGSVMVDYRLLADAVTVDNLRTVISRVLAVADGVGQLLTAVHGGTTPIEAIPFTSDL